MTQPKLCIVAGVGPGIGASVAKRFAKEGFAVALIARRQADLDALAATLGTPAKGYSADLTDFEAIKQTFSRIQADFGPASVLVYNASRMLVQPAMEIDPETFHADLALCCTGALACAQQVYPAMKQAHQGSILITGGGLALHPEYGAGIAALTAGKSAIRGLTLALAKELAPDGIHVATVTVAGTVQPGTPYDPDIIAEDFITLHNQPQSAWQVERVFRPSN